MLPWAAGPVLIVAAIAAWRCAAEVSSRRLTAAGGVALVAVLFGLLLSRRPMLAVAWIPSVAYFDFRWWFIPCGIFLIRLGARQKAEAGRARESRAFGMLAIALAVFMAVDWARHLPPDGDRFTGMPDAATGLCRQSCGYSCTAAAAVTLLHQFDFATTEREMVQRCRTGTGGTQTMGAIYGIQSVVAQRGWRVRLDRPEGKNPASLHVPCLVSLRFSLGVDHSVCVLAVDAAAGTLTIADPLGKIRETKFSMFARDWRGDCLYLEKK